MDSLLNFPELQGLKINFTDSNNNNNNDDFDDNPVSLKEDKYSLRPRSLRRLTEKLKVPVSEKETPLNGRQTSKNSTKNKPKSAPLSKYRRKTANARERNRMREINEAFETLRQVIPHMQAPATGTTNEKLTKITTLRLAMKYISALSAALNNPSMNIAELQQQTYSDLDCLLLESDGESLSISDHSSSLLSSPDFPESSLSPVDFGDPSLLHTDFTEHTLETTDLSEFLFT